MKKSLVAVGALGMLLATTGCGGKHQYTNHIQRAAHSSQAHQGAHLYRGNGTHHGKGHTAKYIPGQEHVRGNKGRAGEVRHRNDKADMLQAPLVGGNREARNTDYANPYLLGDTLEGSSHYHEHGNHIHAHEGGYLPHDHPNLPMSDSFGSNYGG